MSNSPSRSDPSRWRGLYAIVDPAFCCGRDPLTVTAAIVAGGCAVIQLRAKQLHAAALEALARDMLALCRAAAIPLVINDHAELAQRIGADGVHLGQSDLPLATARARSGLTLTIGQSTHDLEQARHAQARGADLIGFGPVFPTRTKDDLDPVVGVSALREVCNLITIPVVAIGGITRANIADVVDAGATMAAAISAVCSADDPCAAARDLHGAYVD